MNSNQYSYLVAFWKGLYTFLAVLTPGEAVLAALPESPSEFSDTWPLYAASAGFAVLRVITNALKNRHLQGNPVVRGNARPDTRGSAYVPAMLAPLLAPLLLVAGCATSVSTNFSETVYDEYGNPSTTTYQVKSKGDVDSTVHEFLYRYGGDENTIAVGQSAQGITSPAQTDALRALLSLPPDVLRSLIPVGDGE